MSKAKELLKQAEAKLQKYNLEGHELTLKGFDPKYADTSGPSILHRLIKSPELAVMKSKLKVTIEAK